MNGNRESSMALPLHRSRRAALGALAAWALAPAHVFAQAQPAAGAPERPMHFPFGEVFPVRPIPAWKVTTSQGRTTDLASLLHGRFSAVQLMFTGCSAICPIQGALFAQVQAELQRQREALPVQLVSISVDPLGDSPAALDKWLHQFGAAASQWVAVAPRVEDVGRLNDLLDSGGESVRKTGDVHSGQVFLVNRRGELVYRTASMPSSKQVIEVLERLVRAA